MSETNFPLDPREIAEIEEMVADLDGALQQQWRQKLTRRAQKAANEKALDRKRYRAALERAQAEGLSDPEDYAHQVVTDQRLIDLHNQRLRSIAKRVEIGNRKRRDKLEVQLERASKTANRTQRRFAQADRQYLQIVGEADKDGHLDDTSLVLSKLKKLGTYRLPHWEKTTIALKVMAMSLVSSDDGAVTINLRINSEMCSKALGSGRGPASYMQDAIRRSLERTFGKEHAPQFWFVIETDSDDRFHLHGAVELPSSPNAVGLIDDALRRAGGLWDNSRGQHHQQLTKAVDNPLWWAFYAVKTMNIGNRRIDGPKLYASTADLRRRAANRWDEIRSALPQ